MYSRPWSSIYFCDTRIWSETKVSEKFREINFIFTYILKNINFREIYEDLLLNGVMKPLESKIEGLKSSEVTDYVVPNGMSSLVKHFFKKSGVSPIFQKNVNNIKIVDNDKIAVSTSVSSPYTVSGKIRISLSRKKYFVKSTLLFLFFEKS